MEWFENTFWNDEIHQLFYKQYQKAPPALQETALIAQAKTLIQSINQDALKAAESLLLLWHARHFNTAREAEVEALIEKVSLKLKKLES